MHIEWEEKEIESENLGSRICRVAMLMNGTGKEEKTCVKTIAELGSFEERYFNAKVRTLREFHQGLFWVSVDKKLDQLSLERDVRGAIEAEISDKIPRPGPEWALWSVTCIPCYE